MGPLVYYCRWQGAKLRLRGRDEGAVWGLLITRQGDAEVTEPFRFGLRVAAADGSGWPVRPTSAASTACLVMSAWALAVNASASAS